MPSTANKQQPACTVCSCNRLFNEKTLHPLVSVIDLSHPCGQPQLTLDSYAIMLSSFPHDEFHGGRLACDFADFQLSMHAPEKTIAIDCELRHYRQGRLLLFHKDLFAATPQAKSIQAYGFLHYNNHESLHLSASEAAIILQEMTDIARELQWGVDQYSAKLLSGKIFTLLDYTLRFYHRQFITRHDAGVQSLDGINQLIDAYLLAPSDTPKSLPCACKLSAKLGLSAAYFKDLVCFESGKEYAGYLQLRRLELARQLLAEGHLSNEEIACRLGFDSTECFERVLEKATGHAAIRCRHIKN